MFWDCFGVFRCGGLGVGCRIWFWVWLAKTTRNVTWGSILTPCRKMLKTAEKLKGLTKIGQNATWSSGEKLKSTHGLVITLQ